jgi:hypothetical protein
MESTGWPRRSSRACSGPSLVENPRARSQGGGAFFFLTIKITQASNDTRDRNPSQAWTPQPAAPGSSHSQTAWPPVQTVLCKSLLLLAPRLRGHRMGPGLGGAFITPRGLRKSRCSSVRLHNCHPWLSRSLPAGDPRPKAVLISSKEPVHKTSNPSEGIKQAL